MKIEVYLKRELFTFPIDISKGINFYAPTEGYMETAVNNPRSPNGRVKVFFPKEKLDQVQSKLKHVPNKYYAIDFENYALYLRIDSGIPGLRNPSKFNIVA